jgi:hypothetical protein
MAKTAEEIAAEEAAKVAATEAEEEAKKVAAAAEKRFTQADLDRVAQQKQARIKKLEAELEEVTSGGAANLEKYESIVSKTVADMTADVAEPIKKLLAKLSPLEQFEYLNDPANGALFEKKPFPVSPLKSAEAEGGFRPDKSIDKIA